jgi:hypothetical protein
MRGSATDPGRQGLAKNGYSKPVKDWNRFFRSFPAIKLPVVRARHLTLLIFGLVCRVGFVIAEIEPVIAKQLNRMLHTLGTVAATHRVHRTISIATPAYPLGVCGMYRKLFSHPALYATRQSRDDQCQRSPVDRLSSPCRFWTGLFVEFIQSQYFLPDIFRKPATVESAAAVSGM